MACISPDPGQDLVRLANLREVDLVLVDGRRPLLGQGVPRGDPGTSLAEAPSDVAFLVGPSGSVPDIGPDRPVVVPLGGAAHDWAALELGAHVASTYGAPIRLLGATVDPMAGQWDGTDPLADAALVVEQLTGVATEPVLVSPAEVEKLGRDAGLLAVGISRRWQVEGLGVLHAEVARTVPTHVLFVRRGTRSGMLTWPPQGRDLPGLLGVGVPYRTGAASDGVGGDHQHK